MATIAWILLLIAGIGLLAFLAIRERRSGRRVAPDALRRRRDDTFRMQAASEFLEAPRKDPKNP